MENVAMADEQLEEMEIGECALCHEQRELVATMTVTARKGGAVVGTRDVDLCEPCAHAAIREAAPLAESVTIDGIRLGGDKK